MSEYDETCPCCGLCLRDGHADECELMGAYEALEEAQQERGRLLSELETAEQERDEARTEAEAAVIADLREGAALLKSGWSWGGIESRTRMPCCRTDMASVLEAAANRFERGEHRKENE